MSGPSLAEALAAQHQLQQDDPLNRAAWSNFGSGLAEPAPGPQRPGAIPPEQWATMDPAKQAQVKAAADAQAFSMHDRGYEPGVAEQLSAAMRPRSSIDETGGGYRPVNATGGPAAPPAPQPADPNSLHFEAQPGGAGTAKPGASPNFLASLGAGGTTKVAAQNTPLVDPSLIAGIQKDQAAQNSALERQGIAQQQEAVTKGLASQATAEELAKQKHETLGHAEEQDKYIKTQTERLAGLQHDLDTSSVDPEHWTKSLSTADHIRWTVASFFGAFGAALTHSPDGVAESLNRHIANDLVAQKENIERKKGAVAGQEGILAAAYRRFGNMNQAMNAAHVIALQQVGAEADAHAALSSSDTAKAQNDALQAKLREEQKRGLGALYHYTSAHAVAIGPAMPTLAQYNKEREVFDKEHPGETFPAFNEWAPRALGMGGAAPGAPKGKEGTPDERYKKYQDEVTTKGETPLSRAEWDAKTSGATATSPGASVPAPESTAWSPYHLLPGGAPQSTETAAKERVHARYNAAVTKGIIDKYGRGAERNEKLIESLTNAYKVNPGDTQETIDQKIAAAHADLGMSNAGASKGYQITPVGR